MKTKSTSDTLVLERCCKSTMPFALDDPKSTDGIGEILIDLCNGRQIGNMKVGVRKPRTIPLIIFAVTSTWAASIGKLINTYRDIYKITKTGR